MKRFMKRLFLLSGLFGISWLIFAQSCMTFRKSDREEKAEFAKHNVALTTGTIRVASGRSIHYAQTGNDSLPTLFFIHGSPGSWDAFSAYMKDSQLLKKFRMVSIDRPGFGYSDFGLSEHLDVQSRLISPLFIVLNNHKPRFMAGHSLGGPMVLQLAADNPDSLFSGLVIISGSIDPAEEKPEKWRPWLFKTSLNYLVPGAMRPSNEELWFLKKDLVLLKGKLGRITCPVYFIHGAQDPWVPPANVDYGKKQLVHAAFIRETLIPGANHFIPWTKFNEIRSVLLKLY
ncbi:MAG: alpha/beta hydrolase [Bacteroidota bacterium]|nr:alpha/beta hydrolase [Bacteroidota bacterium]MDP4212200.1 alpha/beta hydrolase [Bacteroidota bacterium]MDP4249050.1 alpha/beta hydrolase [Bacteroidota bacterium]